MSDVQTVRLKYEPRAPFIPFHDRHQQYAALVCHRRAGKTVAAINEAVARAIYNKKKRPRYAYIAPERAQAKKVAWEYVKEYTAGLEKKKPSESELTVRMAHNDATIELFGADGPNADSLRGNYFDGAIVDEYGDMKPSVWIKIIMPTLTDRNGWVVFIGTYKGKNHFYRMCRNYQGLDLSDEIDPVEFKSKRFFMLLRADQSGIISAEKLAELKMAAIAEGDEDGFRQEYLCDPDAAIKGTYYASIISQLEGKGRIYSDLAAFDPDQEVECVFDIGRTDGTACWFWQRRPGGIAIIDYFSMEGKGCEEAFAELNGRAEKAERRKNYRYRKIHLPHDAKAKTFATRRSTIEQFLQEYGSSVVSIVPRLDLVDGIAATRKVLPMCWFHKSTMDGVEGLRAYQRDWDEDNKCFKDTPKHNWASHPADSFRYLSLVADGITTEDKPEEKRIIVPSGGTLNELFEQHERRMRMLRRRG